MVEQTLYNGISHNAPPTPAAFQDATRARELYNYFVPEEQVNAIGKTNSDPVLTSHAQLVAWRLNAQRALISLMDRDTQYFVAEGTKTMQLDDITQSDTPDDATWAACSNVPKTGRICEWTLGALPPPEGGPAYFEVTDLSQDDRFNRLPFIQGPPYFRYYVGVPLVTKKGIAIGSLCALDTEVRQPVNPSMRAFLGTMADNIMTHFETVKERDDRRRALNMNACLASFVDPERQVRTRRKRRSSSANINGLDTPPSESPHKSESLRPEGRQSPRSAQWQKMNNRLVQDHLSENGSAKPKDSLSEPKGSNTKDDEHRNTFRRAALLIHEALELGQYGGIVFLSTMEPFRGDLVNATADSGTSESDSNASDLDNRRKPPVATSSLRPHGSDKLNEQPNTARAKSHSQTQILATSTDTFTAGREVFDEDKLRPPDSADLSVLLRRYPRGKLLTYDEWGAMSGSSGEEAVPAGKRRGRSKAEAYMLLRHFPRARQIMFLPILEQHSNQWSAMLVYNQSEYRTFSQNPDFLYCMAFGNCIQTELARLAIITADRQKSDFIGSISHELRSPLHGILASCEFLAETECSSFQSGLVATADSCARTLLDTINMVLDYSKLNAFQRNMSQARRSRKDNPGAIAGSPLQPALNIYGDVDLAAITEEVVEGAVTGQIHKDITRADLGDEAKPHQFDGSSADRENTINSQVIRAGKGNVDILVDIESRDWTFVTQPGAFRRIVMNLVGNSLKYTNNGFIKVKLEAHDDGGKLSKTDGKDGQRTSSITLTVIDTGKGISQEYMRTKLFTPFAQENTLTPGTGLGLSLVKEIVTMLSGEIHIKSALGVGTEVTVRLPMVHSHSLQSTPSSGTSTASSIERVKDDSIDIVKRRAAGRAVSLHIPIGLRGDPVRTNNMNSLRRIMSQYFLSWYGFQSVIDWTPEAASDIVVVDEADLEDLLRQLPLSKSNRNNAVVLVLCTSASSYTSVKARSTVDNVELVCMPIGPHKLARAVRLCLEMRETTTDHAPGLHASGSSAGNFQEAVEPITSSVETLTLHTGAEGAPQISIVKQGVTIGNQDSSNALKAMDSFHPSSEGSSTATECGQEEYPFPTGPNLQPTTAQNLEAVQSSSKTPTQAPPAFRRTAQASPASKTPTQAQPLTITPTTTPSLLPSAIIPLSLSDGSTPTPRAVSETTPSATPRLLLVDDSEINLRLLHTFMKKRNYPIISTASDGAQAVSVFETLLTSASPAPPEIIFMDISMPVLDGLSATRQIRALEAEYHAKLPAMETPAPALIVALTGLASARDQSDAFLAGVDLYMTKPVSFREVGRLLDNWARNGEKSQVPNGSLTGAIADAGLGAVES